MRRDVGREREIGQHAPRGEVGHEGTREVVLGERDGALSELDEDVAVVHRNEAARNDFLGADGHIQHTRYIIIDNDALRAHVGGDLHLLLEGVAAAADDRHFPLDVDARVVRLVSDAGDDDEVEGALLLAAQHPRDEVVLVRLARDAGFAEVDLPPVRGEEIGRLDAAYRRDGEGRFVRRGRTDGARVGIACKVGVAVGGAVGGGIVVARRDDKADARLLDAVVNGVLGVVVRLAREPARGAEAHVDGVHAEDDGVVEGGDDAVVPRAFARIGEHLERGDLRARRNARDALRLARDDARDVRSVRLCGVDVGVAVRIVIGVGQLGGEVQVVLVDALVVGGGHGSRRERGGNGCHVVLGDGGERVVQLHVEHFVRVVGARIEHGDDGARAVVIHHRRIVDTRRAVHAHLVLGDRLRDFVGVCEHDVRDAHVLLEPGNVLIAHRRGESAQHGVIGKSLFDDVGRERLFRALAHRLDLLHHAHALRREHGVLNGDALLVRVFEQRGRIHLDDDLDEIVRGRLVRLDGDGLLEVIRRGHVLRRDAGGCAADDLGDGVRDRRDHDRRRKGENKEQARRSSDGFLHTFLLSVSTWRAPSSCGAPPPTARARTHEHNNVEFLSFHYSTTLPPLVVKSISGVSHTFQKKQSSVLLIAFIKEADRYKKMNIYKFFCEFMQNFPNEGGGREKFGTFRHQATRSLCFCRSAAIILL